MPSYYTNLSPPNDFISIKPLDRYIFIGFAPWRRDNFSFFFPSPSPSPFIQTSNTPFPPATPFSFRYLSFLLQITLVPRIIGISCPLYSFFSHEHSFLVLLAEFLTPVYFPREIKYIVTVHISSCDGKVRVFLISKLSGKIGREIRPHFVYGFVTVFEVTVRRIYDDRTSRSSKQALDKSSHVVQSFYPSRASLFGRLLYLGFHHASRLKLNRERLALHGSSSFPGLERLRLLRNKRAWAGERAAAIWSSQAYVYTPLDGHSLLPCD